MLLDMESLEILDYALSTLKWTGIGVGAYLALPILAQATIGSTLFQKRIKSHKELEQILSEEAPKLGLNPDNIETVYGAECSSAARIDDGFVLAVSTGFGATRSTVRHELYHIYRDLRKGSHHNRIRYLFIEEPRATLYEFTGIKF